MRPSGLITLTTDFGLADPFVGTMKAVIDARGALRVIDMTHGIPAFDARAAGFWLARFHRYCAGGAVHVAVVDPGVGTARRALAAHTDEHTFLAPDNGLLTEVVAAGAQVRAIDLDRCRRFGIEAHSRTFHGRDLFAPLAAELAIGRLGFDELGEPCEPLLFDDVLPRAVADGWRGRVMVADRFGNLLTNLGSAHRVSPAAVVRFEDRELPWRETYGDIRDGEIAAVLSSFDVIEIARRGAPALAMASSAIGRTVVISQ